MPAAFLPPSEPPYAYVVEYRALDRCFPPACAIKSRDAFGYATELQPDGEVGSYLVYGRHGVVFSNTFYRRGRVLERGETFSFLLPPSVTPSELDASFGAVDENQDFSAKIVVQEVPALGPPRDLDTRTIAGKTQTIGTPSSAAEYAHEGRALQHVRMPLPRRDARLIRVTVTNEGATPLGLGNPLVMKRVEGRGPRQAIWSIFDAVPWPYFQMLFEGRTGDKAVGWVHDAVAKRGVYFPNGESPGECTGCFSRVFLRSGFFNLAGEPNPFRKNFLPPPESVHALFAWLSDLGILTESITANFSVMPAYSYNGMDGGYDSEDKSHTTALTTRFKEWIADHPHDDSFVLWWAAATHGPFPPGRSGPPPPPPAGIDPKELLVAKVIEPMWKNLLETTDRWKEVLDAARTTAPSASRMIYLSADHGRGYTKRMDDRAFRTRGGSIYEHGLSHGVGGTDEEMHAPFILFYDGPNAKESATPVVVEEKTSTLATLHAIEKFFDADLHIPETRGFDSPFFSGKEAYSERWDDEALASLGLGVWRFISPSGAARGDFAYSEHWPLLKEVEIWKTNALGQKTLAGTPYGGRQTPAEELYDRAKDPFEYANVSDARFSDVLRARLRTTDWAAAHYDGVEHAHFRYTLVFPTKVTIIVTGPRPFDAWIDGQPAHMRTPRSAEVTGTRLEIQDGDDSVGIIEIAGDFARAPITLRCASNSLPVDMTSADRPRLNLMLARNMCPVPKTDRVTAPPGAVMYSVEPARRPAGAEPGVAAAGGMIDQTELMAGMKKWGYVRDIEKKP